MSEKNLPTFSEPFTTQLRAEGYPLSDIQAEIARNGRSPVAIVRDWTRLSSRTIREGLYNQERDEEFLIVKQVISDLLKPWRNNTAIEELPDIQVIEIARQVGFSSEKVLRLLTRYPLTISNNGQEFLVQPDIPDVKGDLTLNDARDYGLNPKRLARQSRNLRWTPRARTVMKAFLDDTKVDAHVRAAAIQRAKVVFVPKDEVANGYDDLGVMEDLIIEYPKVKQRNPEAIIYSEPNGKEIMSVFRWFQENGFGNNWILGDNASLFAENLVKLARGEDIDFNIWNCIGFQWYGGTRGEFPTNDITDNLDAAIALYFQARIQEIAEVLSYIGNPQINILIPSNEALDNTVWRYEQTIEERQRILDDAVEGLRKAFSNLELPANVALSILRWDEYIRENNALQSQQEYSLAGRQAIERSPKCNKIVQEALKSGSSYLRDNGVDQVDETQLAQYEIGYYGVYAGEGVFWQELAQRGKNIVVINFEEFRVPQMAMLGAQGELCVVTPITPREMQRFYQWELGCIDERKNKNG